MASNSIKGVEWYPTPQWAYPVVGFTYDQDATTAKKVNFTNATVAHATDAVATWAWDFNEEEATASTEDAAVTFASYGTFPVVLTATTQAGVEHELTVSVEVKKGVTANFQVLLNEGTPGGRIFRNTSTYIRGAANTSTFAWDAGDSTGTATTEDFTYAFEEDGTYQVELTVTNAAGEVDVVTIPVTIAEGLIAE